MIDHDTLTVRAVVTRGHGWATRSQAEDVARLAEISGTTYVDGSLNLIGKSPVWLDARAAIHTTAEWAYWRASLRGMPVVIGRWLSGCPAHVFEIFAPVRLREAFNLRDGDALELCIPRGATASADASWRNRLVWYGFWRFRERAVYGDGVYSRFVHSRLVGSYVWRSSQRR